MGVPSRAGDAGTGLPLQGIVWGVAAALAWAIYNVGAKVGAAEGFRPADLTLMRFGIAGLVMLAPLVRLGPRRLAGIGWRRGTALTALVGPPFGLVVNTGFTLAPLAHGVVLGPASTMLSAMLLAWACAGERPRRAQLAGMAILLLGLVAIAGDGLGTRAGGMVWLGDLAFVAAGSLWGGFTFLLRRWRIDGLRGTAVVSVLSMALYVPGYLAFASPPDLPASAFLTQALCQGILGGCVGVLAYGVTVARLGATRAALFPSFVPALATLLAVPVLGQIPSALQAAGIALCSLGLLTALGLLARRRQPAVAQEEPA